MCANAYDDAIVTSLSRTPRSSVTNSSILCHELLDPLSTRSSILCHELLSPLSTHSSLLCQHTTLSSVTNSSLLCHELLFPLSTHSPIPASFNPLLNFLLFQLAPLSTYSSIHSSFNSTHELSAGARRGVGFIEWYSTPSPNLSPYIFLGLEPSPPPLPT